MKKNKDTLHLKRDSLSSLSNNESSSLEREVQTVNDSSDNSGEITGPDGKTYYRRKKKSINANSGKLNAPSREGYHRCLPTDRDPHTLQDMIDRGYSFVDQKEFTKVKGGVRDDHSPYFHYLMEIPLDEYESIQRIEQQEITEKEDQMLKPEKKGVSVPQGYENKIVRNSKR